VPDFQITWLDIGVVVTYIAITIAIGVWFARGKRDTEGYFLGGRNFIWPLVGLSLFATNQSGTSFIGLSSSGYADGIAVFNYEWVGALVLIFFVVVFLPFYLRSQVYTMPEFLENRFNRKARYGLSVYTVLSETFLSTAASLYAGGLVINLLFPEVPLWMAIVTLGVVAGVYTIAGGLTAVVITDTIQAVTIIVGSIAITVMVFTRIDSWSQVRQATPEASFDLIRPATDPAVPWPALLTGLVIISIYYFCMNQVQVQRVLGARNMDHGRWGSLLAGLLKLTLLFIIILPATAAVVLYPNLDNPDRIWPILAFDLLPIGLRGVLLAALIAALMSTIDSNLNAISTIITMDFVRTLRPDIGQQALVGIGRIATAILMIIAVTWAPQITNFPTLWEYFQSAVSYLTPSIVAVFVMGIFWRRVNGTAAFATIVVGLSLGVVGFILNEVIGVFEIQFLYAAAILFAFACVLMVAISLLTSPPPAEKTDGLIWNNSYWREESRELAQKPLYYNYRYWSIALAGVTAIIVIVFW
jgi:solute:Na+ symporter, SSS family